MTALSFGEGEALLAVVLCDDRALRVFVCGAHRGGGLVPLPHGAEGGVKKGGQWWRLDWDRRDRIEHR